MAGIASRLTGAAKALMGISAYSAGPVPLGGSISDAQIEEFRKQYGGQLQRIPQTQTRWHMADLESAQHRADSGYMQQVGQLWRAMKRDGYIGGLTQTRTAGLVALPKQFRGNAKAVEVLKAETGTRSVFDEMFPPQELAQFAGDLIGCGVALAELQPVEGREHPVMVRMDPEWLVYRWNENRWYYQSIVGLIPIDPGNGKWMLATYSRTAPWQQGLWLCLGRAYIIKEHAMLMRANFSSKLANPARVAFMPQASEDSQKASFLQQLMQWGINSVFTMPAGYDAKLLESNGRGYEVFEKEINTSDAEAMIALAGQIVTVTGGAGFSNASIHQTIRADLIKHTADALAHCINTQGIPPWVFKVFGAVALDEPPRVEWDIAPPADRKADAEALTAVGDAITRLRSVLAAGGLVLDVTEIVNRYRIPIVAGVTPEVIEEPEEADKAAANGKGNQADSDEGSEPNG